MEEILTKGLKLRKTYNRYRKRKTKESQRTKSKKFSVRELKKKDLC